MATVNLSKRHFSKRAALLRRMRGALYFKPLAMALAFLLMPHMPVLEKVSAVAKAQAQSAGGCNPTQYRIIQDICESGAPTSDLLQFENETIQAFLEARGISSTDAPLIFEHGRSDLRSEIRAAMFTRLQVIAEKPSRTTHESVIFKWHQNRVWKHEKALYHAAVTDRDHWKNDPCGWKPDPDVMTSYGLTYNGSYYCATNPFSLFQISPPAPTADYFLAAALKQTYGHKTGTFPDGAAIANATLNRTAVILGVAAISGVVAGAAMGIAFGTYLTIVAAGLVADTMLKTTFAYTAAAIALGKVSVATTVTGPVAVVLFAVVVGVVAGFKAFHSEKTFAELAALDAKKALAESAPPDLVAFGNDPTGLFKLNAAFVETTLPEFASSSLLPAHGPADGVFQVTPQGGGTNTSEQFTYRDWTGTAWTAKTYRGWLVQNAVKNGTPVSSFAATIEYQNWSGARYMASRYGAYFLLTKTQVNDGDSACESNTLTGVSNPPNLDACSSYVSSSIELKDGNGNNVSVRMAKAPVFTSAPAVTFTNGMPKTFEINATGGPLPTVSLASGSLPAGIRFENSDKAGLGKARLVFSGTAPDGNINLILRAANAQGFATQAFTIMVASTVKITSASTARFMSGIQGSFTVMTSGYPIPTIAGSFGNCALPYGITLVDNRDGTARLSGTPTGFVASSLCTIVATNGLSSAQQSLTVVVEAQPQPKILSAGSVDFIAGVRSEFTVVTGGAISPVNIGLPCSYNPSWLGITDHHNGTATMVGVPPKGTSGTFETRIEATLGPVTSDLCQNIILGPGGIPTGSVRLSNFKVNVVNKAVFTSPSRAWATVGETGSFQITTNQQVAGVGATMEGVLPAGVEYVKQTGGGYLKLTPQPGTGGSYPLTFQYSLFGGATQPFHLDIHEPPALPGYDVMNFPVGESRTFPIEVTGYPRAADPYVPFPYSLGMRVSETGVLPAGVKLMTTGLLGTNTGSPVLSGMPQPGSEGTYRLTITADNSVGSPATKQFTINVIKPGDINADQVIDCIDIGLIKAHLATRIYQVGFDPRADANNDGIVNEHDLVQVEALLPKHTKCK